MLISQRQKEILEILKSSKFVSVNEQAKQLFISAASIRRDLLKLEKLGHITGLLSSAAFASR